MTLLSDIQISDLRNLSAVDVHPGPHFNILTGNNGSGKTSFLEAIYSLGLGRSFRTRLHSRVINHEADQYTVFANVIHDGSKHPVGIQKSRNGENLLRLSGEPASPGTLAEILPIQLIYPDGYKLLTGGSKVRRQFLDWGVFHVEQSFYPLWLRAQRALKQRNRLLKNPRLDKDELRGWNVELSNVATSLDASRKSYVEKYLPLLQETLALMALPFEISVEYSRGWHQEAELLTLLNDNLARDLQLKYTQYGPHKADLIIRSANLPAHDVLSQGQTKMLIYAMRLAQSQLLQSQTNKTSIYLIDDLPAELDQSKREILTDLLANSSAQVFITGIEQDALQPFIDTPNSRLFHVKHGQIQRNDCST